MNKNRLYSFILSLMLLVGLSLLLYPSISNYWNSFHSSKAISNYTQVVSEMDEEAYEQMLEEVRAYNAALLERDNPYLISKEMEERYHNLLNPDGSGLMGYLEIPSIDCSTAIYHTTEERVLQKAVGHLTWTSLPMGGESTHCVLSGHRGLPTAKLFSSMDKVVEGDYFYIHILDEVLKYQVDQILIVEPKDAGALEIVPGKDYCTLVTCTPYGINTHRMLVRGVRVDVNEKPKVHVTAEALQIEPIIVAAIISIPILLLLLIWLHIPRPKRTQKRGELYESNP